MSQAEKNRHVVYLKPYKVHILGVGDMSLRDYMDRIGAPARPIVVNPDDESYVAPTAFPIQAIRLLVAEYARSQSELGYSGRYTTEDDAHGNQWNVCRVEEQYDSAGQVISPQLIRLTVSRGHFKRVGAESQLRRVQGELAVIIRSGKSMALNSTAPGDFEGAERQKEAIANHELLKVAAEAKVAELSQVINSCTEESFYFPIDPSALAWFVRV